MPSLLKANDSGKMYDVPDNERDDALASGKFTEHFRIKTKDSGKEYIVPAQEMPEALQSGKFELAEFYDQKKNIEANPTMPKMNPVASFALKAGNTMSMGFGDEIIGALGGDKEGIRKQLKASEQQNPAASFAGGLAGGIASPSLIGAGKTIIQAIGKGALAGAISGGIQGAGENVKREDLLGDIARGAGFGGVLGAGGGVIGKAIASPKQAGKALSNVAETVGDTGGAIKASYEGFKSPTGIDGAVAGNFARIPKASTEFFKYFKEADINRQDIADIATKLRQEIPGAANIPDDQLFLQAMSEPGQNSAKLFAANRVKASGGDEKAFLNLLNKAPEETAAGRAFNKVDSAHEIAGGLSKTYDSFRAVERQAFEGLKNKARASFPKQDSSPMQAIYEAQIAAQKKKGTASAAGVLEDVFNDLTGGLTDQSGRNGTALFTELSPAEQFDRILQARQSLDKNITWASKNALPESEQILSQTRKRLDAFLKPFDDMAKADKGYSRFKRLEEELFAKLGTKQGGQIVAFEPTKVEDLLGGTKTSRRLGAALEGFKRQLASGEISPEARSRIEPIIKQIDDALSKSKTQRELTAFRYEAGPTSPAVQQLSQKIKPQSVVDLAGDSPQLFLKLRETIPENARAMFNKGYQELTPDEKVAVTKFSAWRLNNLKASERQVNDIMKTFAKPK